MNFSDLSEFEHLAVKAALDGEDEFGWVVEETICDRCGRESISVYPLGMGELECPGCGYTQPVQEIMAN